jgi:ferric-dicitrate binding protein FerR (iron transport regulator)
MTNSSDNDPVWQAALDWVLSAQQQPLDAPAAAALAAWLAQDPAHRKAYEKATRVWLLTGLIPLP